eukprot:m.25210 g.25210  ORF g.25210 m.25210 type:complete len:362 (+) comp6174_c0_seq1:46-1131(+)
MQREGSAAADDEETVWAADTEEAFREALLMYPPPLPGKGKIKIQGDDGKMYGRNELIAYYIFNKTGKVRTRKQVSSHIQVLARKQQREGHPVKGQSSSEIVTQAVYGEFEQASAPPQAGPGSFGKAPSLAPFGFGAAASQPAGTPLRRIVLTSLYGYLRVEMAESRHDFVVLEQPDAFESPHIETVDVVQVCDKLPGVRELLRLHPHLPFHLVKCWVDLSYDNTQIHRPFFGTTATYMADEAVRLERSTSVFSLGKQVIEKVQVATGTPENGGFVYSFVDAPMCQDMVNFIQKVRALESPELANKVLENLGIVEVLRDEITQEVVGCTAFMFETSLRGYGAQCNVYRLYETVSESERRFTA